MPSIPVLLLTTEQRVHAFDLAKIDRIRIGRHASNEVCLRSRTVSNFHAEILQEQGALFLRDLGSTNGTLLNGEPIDRSGIASGDRIRVGNHLLGLTIEPRSEALDSSGEASRFGPGARGKILVTNPRILDSGGAAPRAEGNDGSFADLLERMASLSVPVRAVVECESERALVYVLEGQVVHAEHREARGEKALYRIFGWQQARYEIQAVPMADEIPVSIFLPRNALVSEGLEHSRDLGRLVAELPPLAAPLRLKEDCPLPLTAHSPAEIEIFQSIIRHETLEAVVANSPFPDVRILRLVQSLLRKGVFEEASSNDALDETSSLL